MDRTGEGKDDEIMVAVEHQLEADERTKDSNIEVSSMAGEVTLSGMVGSEAAKMAAEQMARSVPGVMLVVNELVVESDAQRQDDNTVPRAPLFFAGNPSGTAGTSNLPSNANQV